MTGYDGRATLFPLTIVRAADMAFTVTATDSDAAAIDLSAATIAGELYDFDGTLVDTFTAAVSGAGSNIITLSFTDTETTALTSDAYSWTLWVTRGGDTRPWLAGPVRLTTSTNGGPGTSGTAVTATVDSNVNVSVSVNAVGGGDVASVNGATGVVVLDADDIDDAATINRFATAAQLAAVDGLAAAYAPIFGDDEEYGIGWDGATDYPTKNAVYDRIETIGSGDAATYLTVVTNNGDPITDAATARPVGAIACLWVMSFGVTPTNAVFPDIINTAELVAVDIELVGVGVEQVVKTATTVTAAWPVGYTATAGDVAIVSFSGYHNTGSSASPTPPAGYDLLGTQFTDNGTWDIQLSVYGKYLVGGESAPATTVPAAYANATFGGIWAQVAVYRNVHSTILDGTAVGSSRNTTTGTTWVPTGVSTTYDASMVLSLAANQQACTLDVGNEQGFMLAADSGIFVQTAYKIVDPAASVTCPTWKQTTGLKAAAVTLALRPA